MPDRWWFLPIKEGNVRVASFYGLSSRPRRQRRSPAPKTLDSWLSAAEGDASGFWFLSLLADLTFPAAFVWGEYAAVVRPDAQAASDYFSADGQERDSILDDAGTAFNWGWRPAGRCLAGRARRGRIQPCADVDGGDAPHWRDARRLDAAAVATRRAAPVLPNGQQVVLAELGHTDDFWTYQPEASTG